MKAWRRPNSFEILPHFLDVHVWESESRLAYAPTVSRGFLPCGSPRFPASYFRRFLTLPYGDFSLHNRSQLIKLYETNRALP